MASLFEEIGALDRPFIPVTLKINGRDVAVTARRPSAREQDSLDTYQMNEYGRVITESDRSVDGNLSELERVKRIYTSRPKSDLVQQMLPTRADEIRQLAADLAGVDLGEESLKMAAMGDEERAAYVKQRDEEMKTVVEAAKKQVAEDIDKTETMESLVDYLAQVNINIKAQLIARRNAHASFLYYVLYRPTGDGSEPTKRAFDSPEQVQAQFTKDGIEDIFNTVAAALKPVPASEPQPTTDTPDEQ